jgi:TM2 domain-containing membrane protein YozV
MFDAFISYSSRDHLIAEAVKHKLEAAGIRCWKAPENIEPGAVWEEAIIEAIGFCPLMILIWSGFSQDSKQVNRELTLAASAEKTIIPFRIENIQPQGAFAYYLSNTHWLDAATEPIEQHLEQLCRRVSSTLQHSESICPQGKEGGLDRLNERAAPVKPSNKFIKRKRLVASFLAFLLGFLGLHKFYLGMVPSGLVFVSYWIIATVYGKYWSDLVLGLLCFLVILLPVAESIVYLSRSAEDFYTINLVQRRPWF